MHNKNLTKIILSSLMATSVLCSGTAFAEEQVVAPQILTNSKHEIINQNNSLVFEDKKNCGIFTDILLDNSSLDIKADKLSINSLTESKYTDRAANNFAGWLQGNSILNIDVNELYLGSKDMGGDRGFQFKNVKNTLNINANKVVAYVGDSFINAQGADKGDNVGTSVVNIGSKNDRIEHFEVHTTYGKDDYGVAILQANEGNTINLYADKVILDGSINKKGGVIGTGGFGTVNVDAKDLTINGNICGSYGGRSDGDKTASLNITTDKLNMTGDINVGSIAESHSDFIRKTEVNLTVNQDALINGDINLSSKVLKQNNAGDSIANIVFNGNAQLNGTINVEGTTESDKKADVTLNLGGNADMTTSTGSYNISNGGNVNFTGGKWQVNKWIGENGNVSVGNNTTLVVNDNIDVNKFAMKDNAIIEVDAQNKKFNEDAAITAKDYIIADKAKVEISNVDTNTAIKVFDDKNTNEQIKDQIVTDNMMQDVVYDKDSGKFITKTADASEVLNGAVLGNIVTGLTENNNKVEFFQSILKSGDNKKAVNAINGVSNMAELGGVIHGTYSMSNSFTDEVQNHLSKVNHTDVENDIWTRYIHNKENISNMKLGGINANYDAQFNGIVVGSDFYNEGKTTLGAAFMYADGNISGNNSDIYTKNEANYYGVSVYGRIDNGDNALLGDISYLHSSNDVIQYNNLYKLTISPDVDTFSIGFKAEKVYDINSGKFVPYVGARYMHMGVGDYTNNIGMRYDADEQNILLLPIGVKYSTEIKNNDWTIRPIAEIGYVWITGDNEAEQMVSLNGLNDGFNFDISDDNSFVGKIGLEMENDNLTYGLGYEYQKGDTVKANRWTANVTFRF